jgi:hypothetical protein
MTMRAIGSAIALWAAFHAPTVSVCAASEEASRALPPFRVVDLNIGERQSVRLPDETIASVSLLEVNETRGDVRGAVRQASVVIELSGQQVELGVARNDRSAGVEDGGTIDLCTAERRYVAQKGEEQ